MMGKDEGSSGSLRPTLDGAGDGPALSSDVRREVERYLTEAVARFGTPGAVTIEDQMAVLRFPGGREAVDIGTLAEHWAELDETTRRGRALDIARALAQPRALRSAQSLPPRARFSIPWLGILIAAALSGGVYYLLKPAERGTTVPTLASHRGASPASSTDSGAPPLKELDADRCRSSLARVAQGSTLTPIESSGWVVEWVGYLPAAPDAAAEKGLNEFFGPRDERGKAGLVWVEEPELNRAGGSGAFVTVQKSQVKGALGVLAEGIIVTFEGPLASPYFDSEGRLRYYHIAHAMASRFGAKQAALYARCEGGQTHHLGSWFRGSDETNTVQALLYSMGAHTEPPPLKEDFTHASGSSQLDPSVVYQSLLAGSAQLDRRRLSLLLGKSGGMIVGTPGEPITITFQFRDGNRATRASREIIKAVGLSAP